MTTVQGQQGQQGSSGPELVVMVGLQGSGKSSLVRRLFGDHVVVSKDHWPNARRREQRQLRVVEEHLREGRSVVVDNTNASAARRAGLLELAGRLGVPARAVFVDTPYGVCEQRNARRGEESRVPDVGLRATAAILERPTEAEGFRVVTVIPAGSSDAEVAATETVSSAAGVDHLDAAAPAPSPAAASVGTSGVAPASGGDEGLDRYRGTWPRCEEQPSQAVGGVVVHLKLELVPVPVADVDRAMVFYRDQVGFVLDVDVRPAEGVRVVQLTPPGSACSILLSTGLEQLSEVAAGSVKGLHLVVQDIRAAREELARRGVGVSEAVDVGGGVLYAWFSDPDGNSWALQEMPWRTGDNF